MIPGLFGNAGFVSTGGVSVEYIGSFSSGSSVSFGATDDRRRIFAIVSHGDTVTNPGSVSCSIGGASATRYVSFSTGNGLGEADGVAIFGANPLGASGTVTFNWSPAPTSCALFRTIGYSTTANYANDKDGSNLNLGIPAGGLLFAVWRDCTLSSGVTFKHFINSTSIGYDTNMSLETPRTVSFSSYIGADGGSANCAASFSLL